MKIAIQGHPTRGKEVIQIFKDLGTEGLLDHTGLHMDWVYLRDDSLRPNQLIVSTNIAFLKGYDYNVYTLEEFEKEFPFKIGDKVIHFYAPNSIGIVVDIKFDDHIPYRIDIDGKIYTCGTSSLKPYKEMKEERNITLTLDKAKEWYKKGGELKEVALQAYSEKELTKVELPKTWEEFCENYPVQKGESWLGGQDSIYTATIKGSDREYKNWTPSKESAEAHLAMIQLEQLRDCWRQGWVPDWLNYNEKKYSIRNWNNTTTIESANVMHSFLSFQTYELACEFEESFRDLIEKAGDLI